MIYYLAAKYSATDFAQFEVLRYGLEPAALVKTSSDVAPAGSYAFPDDLSQPMGDEDAATWESILFANNIPADIVSGSPFVTAITGIAKLFVLAAHLAVHGRMFTPGISLSTLFDESPIGEAVLAKPNLHPFDFSQVDPAGMIGDVLSAVSQQFADPIYFPRS